MNYPENLVDETCSLAESLRTENEPTCLLGFLEFHSQVDAAFLSDKNKEKLFARYERDFSFPVTQVRKFISNLRRHTEFAIRNGIEIPLHLELKQLIQRDNYHKPLTPEYFFEIEVGRQELPEELRQFVEEDYLAFVSLYIDDVTLSEGFHIDDAALKALLESL